MHVRFSNAAAVCWLGSSRDCLFYVGVGAENGLVLSADPGRFLPPPTGGMCERPLNGLETRETANVPRVRCGAAAGKTLHSLQGKAAAEKSIRWGKKICCSCVRL